MQASQLSLNGSGIGSFSDRGRDAVRGGSAGDSGAGDGGTRQGYVSGLHSMTPTPQPPPSRAAMTLKRAADMVRVGLAGSRCATTRFTTYGR